MNFQRQDILFRYEKGDDTGMQRRSKKKNEYTESEQKKSWVIAFQYRAQRDR